MALKGCCCCGLRGGALAVGIVFLVLSVLHVLNVIISWIAVVAARPVEEVSVNLGQYAGSVSSSGDISVRTGTDEFTSTSRELEGLILMQDVVLSLNTVFALLSLLFNSMLIHGANNSSRCAVLSWLIYYGITFVLFSLGMLGLLIACFVFVSAGNSTDNPSEKETCRVLSLILGLSGGLGLLLGGLFWYCWAVVLAFHQQLTAATAGFRYSRSEVLLEEAPQSIMPPPYAEPSAEEASKQEAREK